ncbi:S53 family peptidase [Nicoliella lavandulae]|uniref:S53 family peptidase n=1 Tax=Nicoliella lavandulae TaxID=3082954 RepID=A0ABU8SKP9_9LACO
MMIYNQRPLIKLVNWTLKLSLVLIVGGLSLTLATNTSNQATAIAATKAKKTVKAVNPKQQQTVNLVLQPNSANQLNEYINQTVTPGNPNYRKYLTPQQFADTYGQSNDNIQTIKNYFEQYQLKTKVYAGNIVLKLTGTTKNVERAFHVKLNNVKVIGNSYQKPNHNYKLPAAISANVLGVFGLANNTYANPAKDLSAHLTKTENEINTNQGAPQKFMDRYNAGALYKNNHVGAGQTVGIISFAKFKPNDATKFWKYVGIPVKKNRIKVYHVTKTAYNGEDETAMDVEQAGAMAPKANLNVYVGNPSALGMLNSLATALAQNKVDTLSISWGQSENQITTQLKLGMLPKNYNQIMNLLFQQAAVQGISTFASTGDNGAYDGMGENRYPKLTVDSPASSPYVTSVGGTTLPRKYTINGKKVVIEHERAWSTDFMYPRFDNQPTINPSINPQKWVSSYFAGGGGGFSTLNSVPDYQAGFSGVGTYRAAQVWKYKDGYLSRLKVPQIITGTNSGRNLPDISGNADPNTGYASYHNGNFYTTGGTSVVTPQMAGMAAVINSAQGKRMGFWNPQIYRFAQTNYSPFTPLESANNNSNLYYTGQPGKLYNQATGLGTINFGKLNDAFSAQQ